MVSPSAFRANMSVPCGMCDTGYLGSARPCRCATGAGRWAVSALSLTHTNTYIHTHTHTHTHAILAQRDLVAVLRAPAVGL